MARHGGMASPISEDTTRRWWSYKWSLVACAGHNTHCPPPHRFYFWIMKWWFLQFRWQHLTTYWDRPPRELNSDKTGAYTALRRIMTLKNHRRIAANSSSDSGKDSGTCRSSAVNIIEKWYCEAPIYWKRLDKCRKCQETSCLPTRKKASGSPEDLNTANTTS